MEADELRSVVNTSPGRIVDCYIDSFVALSIDGSLTVLVENTGYVSASYQVHITYAYVYTCSYYMYVCMYVLVHTNVQTCLYSM